MAELPFTNEEAEEIAKWFEGVVKMSRIPCGGNTPKTIKCRMTPRIALKIAATLHWVAAGEPERG